MKFLTARSFLLKQAGRAESLSQFPAKIVESLCGPFKTTRVEGAMRLAICAVLGICGFCPPVHAQQPATAAISVSTVAAERRPIAKSLGFVGRVEAINRVEIRARVTGFLEAVLFKEGDLIKEGAPLYRIEKGLFQAAVEQAQGALGAQQGRKGPDGGATATSGGAV